LALFSRRPGERAVRSVLPAAENLHITGREQMQHTDVPMRGYSSILGLGFSLEQVVAMATLKPATVINRLPKLTMRAALPSSWDQA
jgi:hypothetical protein